MASRPYEIIIPLGLGCMGELYRTIALARLLLPGREVASDPTGSGQKRNIGHHFTVYQN
jgi:hypothetical protein